MLIDVETNKDQWTGFPIPSPQHELIRVELVLGCVADGQKIIASVGYRPYFWEVRSNSRNQIGMRLVYGPDIEPVDIKLLLLRYADDQCEEQGCRYSHSKRRSRHSDHCFNYIRILGTINGQPIDPEMYLHGASIRQGVFDA